MAADEMTDGGSGRGALLKRGGWQERGTLAEGVVTASNNSKELLALDDALKTLEQIDERRSRVVELKFFGGLTVEEIAEVLKISPETHGRWQHR